MYITKEKLVSVFFIIVTICIVLACGFLITGKSPEEIFKEPNKKESKDSKEGYTTANTQYSSETITQEDIENNRDEEIEINPYDTNINKYDSGNYNVQYHDDAKDIYQKELSQKPFLGTVMVRDNSNNLISIPYTPSNVLPTYYQPGSFIFGSSSYVPNYEDSVYLSRTTGLSTVGESYPSSKKAGGFCDYYMNDPENIEQKCNKLKKDTCASVSCCVLLGGKKCVSGDEKGPVMKANYTDPSIINKDVYYYQGKCYGNCQ